MNQGFLDQISNQIEELKGSGLYKEEYEMTSPQTSAITVTGEKKVLNFCANNYLGLANHPEVVEAAREGFAKWGFGLASVRFICGTQTIHKELEASISNFLKTEDTILYSSCFDANGGLFETLLGPEDAVISDSLNHASIIDGVRLCKAKRFRYKNNDMADLENKLKEAEAQGVRYKLIATDGVFSMDGIIANLKAICDLADQYEALVMVDDCHAAGFIGKNGRGTHEHCDVIDRVDIITGTLGKALGGASGGYTSGKKEIIEWLRQRSRPYLFSNSLCPGIVTASLKVFDILSSSSHLREKLKKNSIYFREKMEALGFTLVPGEHPIIPVMLGDAKLAQEFAARMLDHGIFVIGFCYPVVPKEQARIRTQMSAAHSMEDLDKAIKAFEIVGKELNVI
ncbi:putative 8-amino-7-oxononanoate synthase/2-amino-3-ketobutyrate coenzyme A ligase [Waddlia chondrophila 2032/99]|uniref:2-amino-3-ketobutyrate coenzyme A ligase n=2 Tax=Waddlia chondrophila TaxID=71667 RepID=D6YWJ3_WADCW|nr:glycine C-acetyltransferase [Waddlia chondrophila]ADI38504.1 2-amino-3-ketobutyrate coenzyme A ligase [Waddlia chondrophila WSU 86-1044]CCB91586.1 putative 8-amino-7-oxononanoate synthase/2-amino-3-ketobutyrate coenzyme A ligase [Waddlia chondrophila 2032/99]